MRSMMKRILNSAALLALAAPALASDAKTSATATNGPLAPGSAAASANYQGDRGFARSDTRTGDVNIARGVALGVDQNGLSLSVSHALAPRHGPAIATNFNMSINRNGDVAHSVGAAIATGGVERTATVSGGAGRNGRSAESAAFAHGRTSGGGRVQVISRGESGPRPIVLRPAPVRRIVRLP